MHKLNGDSEFNSVMWDGHCLNRDLCDSMIYGIMNTSRLKIIFL